MKIRKFQQSDLLPIDKIWRTYHSENFSVPNRKTPLVEWVAEENGEVIAYGQVKLFAEAILVLDKGASPKLKVEALKGLLLEAFRGTDNAGLESLHCFVSDPIFASLLIKHFGFETQDPGEMLSRKV